MGKKCVSILSAMCYGSIMQIASPCQTFAFLVSVCSFSNISPLPVPQILTCKRTEALEFGCSTEAVID